MNAELAAIAEREPNPRFMPAPPSAWHDHGNGRCEEVPLVTREFLLTCGIEALYIVLQEMDADERFDASTKEELADLIISKTRGQQPDASMLPPPVIPPRPMTAREKRFQRSVKQQVKDARCEARTLGSN